NRVQHCFVYGLVFRFRLLSTPLLNDAVTFSYGQASVPVRKGLSPFCWCVLSGAHRGRDKGRLCPSLRTGLAVLLHPALQLVVNFQEDQPTHSPELQGSFSRCLPLPGRPIDSGRESKGRVLAFALHRTESIGHLRCCFPSFFRSASPPSCLPLLHGHYPASALFTKALSPFGLGSSDPLPVMNAVPLPNRDP